MEELVAEYQNFESNDQIQMENPYFNEIFNGFSFFLITKYQSRRKEIMKIIVLFEIKNEIIVIDEYKISDDKYLVFCFDETVIIICESELEIIIPFLYQHKNCMIYILKEEIRNILYNAINQSNEEKIILQISTSNSNFKQEIDTFLNYFQIENKYRNTIWKIVRSSIAGFLIKKSYLRTFKNRIKKSSKLMKHII